MGGDDLPQALQTKPANRYKWDFPTAWLLGTRFITSLRDIAISSLFKFDPRDWMRSELIDATDIENGGECWIDFLADSGDSARLVYQLAYLLQQPSLNVEGIEGPLPRGRLLVFGGDTAYPIATRRRLLEHVRAPFIWAARDLGDRKATDNVRLLGVPGNHDYYNALSGFERMFHDRTGANEDSLQERTTLPGYSSIQQASYFAASLPFGWQLWGLDIETQDVDALQKKFFADVAKHSSFRGKRLVVSSKPMFVNHALNPEIEKLQPRFASVELEPAFANDGLLTKERARIDLSGDVHLYERYWGKDATLAKPMPKFPPTDREEGASSRANYASVVSGLGGAFHHPSQVRNRLPRKLRHDANAKLNGQRAPRASWPGGRASDRAIGERLLRPRKLFQAGAVGVIGMLVSWITYSTNEDNFLDLPFHLTDSSQTMRTTAVHLLAAFSLVGVVAALVGASALAFGLSRKLHAQIQDLGPPRGVWGKLTYFLSHNRATWWSIRWVGMSRRNLWGVLITFWAWGPMLALWYLGIHELSACTYFTNLKDGYMATYVATVILTLFLFGLGAVRMGERNGVIGGLAGAALGAVIAALLVWTPYAWVRLFEAHRWAVFLFLAQFGVRRLLVRADTLRWSLRSRRVIALIVFAAIVGVYAVLPVVFSGYVPLATRPVWGHFVVIVAGAYLSCMWLGWYFYLCLLWNAHGNEAGSAARVVSFAEFVRIRLSGDRADVYVIGVEDGNQPTPRLIDHFTITATAEDGAKT